MGKMMAKWLIVVVFLVCCVDCGGTGDTIINVNTGTGCDDDQVVAFSVGSTAQFAPKTYSRVPMNVESVNIGGHFDMTTSIFTVPVTGLYSCYFGASSLGGSTKRVWISLHAGKPPAKRIAVSFDYNDNGHGAAGGTEIRQLSKGDEVSMWAYGDSSGTHVLYGHKPQTTRLSCFLIKKMG